MDEKIHISEHLKLTLFEPTDKPNLVRYLNEPVLYRNTLRIPSPYTEADADQWINNMRETREKQGFISNWAIRHTETRPALVRIEAKVHSYNPASKRVLKKAGFEREGFAWKHTIKNGELIDVILMARIRE